MGKGTGLRRGIVDVSGDRGSGEGFAGDGDRDAAAAGLDGDVRDDATSRRPEGVDDLSRTRPRYHPCSRRGEDGGHDRMRGRGIRDAGGAGAADDEGGGARTYPSCGVGCRLWLDEAPALLARLALLRREAASACSRAWRWAALAEAAEEERRAVRLRLLRRETGGLRVWWEGAAVFGSAKASVEMTSGTVERRSGVLRMERRGAGDWGACLLLVGLTAMVRSMGGGAWVVVGGEFGICS